MNRSPITFAVLLAFVAPVAAQRPTPPAAESRPTDSKTAVDELQKLVEIKKFQEAWARVPLARELARGATGTDALREETRRLAILAGLPVVGAAAGFVGVVAPRKEGGISVAYDATTPGFEEDFTLEDVLPTTQFAERTGATIRRSGGFMHRAIWTNDVRIEIEGVARSTRDFGPVLVDPDEPGDARFLVGFHHNAYFATKYDETRSVTPGHVLLMAGRGAESRAKNRPTQLFGRTTTPPAPLGSNVKCALQLRGTNVEFTTGVDPKSAAKLTFNLKAATQSFRRLRAGLLVRDSEFEVTRIVVSGRVDEKWLEEESARLKATL